MTAASTNKYHAKRTWSEITRRWFDSAAEARRGEALRLLELAGQITNLEYQVPFKLCDKPKISLTVDFRYRTSSGEEILEDVKGVETREFRVKRIWVREKFGIPVKITS